MERISNSEARRLAVQHPVEAANRIIALERTCETLHSAIWAYFQMREGRPEQAESLLRSALPEGYRPIGA